MRKWLLTALALMLLTGAACAQTLILPADAKVIKEEAFCNAASITEAVLPYGMERIESRAFAQSGLQEITLPETITEIAQDAFFGCMDLYADVVEGSYAHLRCRELGIMYNLAGYTPAADFTYTSDGSAITITDYLGSGDTIIVPGEIAGLPVKTIGAYALHELNTVQKIILPEGVTTLDMHALHNCPNLTTVVLPETITAIGGFALAACPKLTSVNLPEGLTLMRGNVFDGCTSLVSITLPQSLEGMGGYVFQNCTSLQNVNIPRKFIQVPESMFRGCTSLTGIAIPEGVTRIVSHAFDGCTSLKQVNLPASLEEIGSSAFRYCSVLDNLVFPDGLKTIGEYAFNECNALSEAILPDSVRSIDKNAFSWCANLARVRLPEQLETLKEYMFTWDTNLREINWPGCLTNIEQFAFAYTSLPEIHLPSTVQTIGSHSFYNSYEAASIILPGSIRYIADHAFVRCGKMTELIFEEGVESIGSYAFAESYAIEHVSFPASMRYLGQECFRGCVKLSSVTFCNSSISLSAFVFQRTNLSGEIIIPDETSYASNSFSRPVTLVCFSDKIRGVAESTMVSLMENIYGPEYLFGNMSADGVSWFQYVVNAGVAFAGGNLSDMNTPVKKRAFLINDAMEIAGGTKQVTFIDTKNMSKALENLNSGAKLTDEYTFEIVSEMNRPGVLDRANPEDIVKLYKQYAAGTTAGDGAIEALKNAGVAENAAGSVVEAFDALKKLSDISDVIGTLSGALDACSQVVDVYNQIQFLDTLDRHALAQTARIYMASGDSAIRDAGVTLNAMANSDRHENIALIATGKLADCGISYMIDGAIDLGTTIFANGPIMATATITTAIVDTFFGVGDVPRLVNEITYAADAAEEAYALFQQELSAYKSSPSTATFGLAAWDYIIYCEAAAQSQDAFVNLYEHLDRAAAIRLSSELRAAVDAARDGRSQLQRKAENGRQVYALWQSGDVNAFRDYIDSLKPPEEE